MDPISNKAALASAGAAGGDSLYVDDVFSIDLYEGSDPTAKTITSGIDLSGEGGLVWTKKRNNVTTHALFDTERGDSKSLATNSDDGEINEGANAITFNSDGHTVRGNYGTLNGQNQTYVSWTFRKAPGFFDIVTWTGNGTTRTISHNLGSTPGFIIIKRYSNTEDWTCWHRSVGATKYLQLNGTGAAATLAGFMNNTEPTSTEFTVSTHDRVNTNGETYIAYLFAHDDQSFGTDSNEAIIKCGSFSGGNSPNNFVDLGFEPQFIISKRHDGTADWVMADIMRGAGCEWGVDDGRRLYANLTSTESGWNSFSPAPTGFYQHASGATSENYLYIAIGRPNKPIESATEVFDVDTFTGNGSAPVISTPFTVDMSLTAWRNRAYNPTLVDRVRGSRREYYTTSTGDEYASPTNTMAKLDLQTGIQLFSYAGDAGGYNLATYSFKRAPGFFDITTHTGDDSSSRNVPHNLGAVPELIILKGSNSTYARNWTVWSDSLSNNHILQLNGDSAEISVGTSYINSATSTTFNVGSDYDVNNSSTKYTAYLFSSLDGVSKVGTYSGTGSTVNVDCGFSAGARFVLIKRVDSSGDWILFDSGRGIESGTEPHFTPNTTISSEYTNNDYIDPLNSGFTITQSAPADLNANGGTYLFLAIA